jgi:hypothetical protein
MNKLITRRLRTVFVFLLIISSVSSAQFNAGQFDFLKSSAADAGKIVGAYIAPWTNAFGSALNGGWYNTAKPHKFGGFDITGNISVGMVPSSAETFSVKGLGLSSNFSFSGSDLAPTVAGLDDKGPALSYNLSGINVPVGNLPPGTKWKLIPAPIVQVGIGLPKGTELKLRYLPKINISDGGDVSLWGVGLMHSIMQYIPGNKLSPFDLSVFGGYTKLDGNVNLHVNPSPVDLSAIPPILSSSYSPSISFNDQSLNLSVAALNVSALGSVNLKVITFYLGLGYCKTTTTIQLKGNYPMPATSGIGIAYGDAGLKKGSDFGNINIEDFSGLRANLGFRLKLGVFTMHLDYTRAQYNVVSAGMGLSFK